MHTNYQMNVFHASFNALPRKSIEIINAHYIAGVIIPEIPIINGSGDESVIIDHCLKIIGFVVRIQCGCQPAPGSTLNSWNNSNGGSFSIFSSGQSDNCSAKSCQPPLIRQILLHLSHHISTLAGLAIEVEDFFVWQHFKYKVTLWIWAESKIMLPTLNHSLKN